ncbi:alkaline phosphatase D family protein [Stenotrophomonas sp.]|uniref:alkaline phosphatase D family protein n=1 Tax=Stenotrophomonas sp. TaxID=69392 RepID=UPI0028A876E5|nr:alkaline phosphatase D family protein [Stenotrophomonas sp.]
MTINIDRRRLLIGASLGLGALLLPVGRAFAAQMQAAKGFTHNVASGEPGPDSLLLWTRYVPADNLDEITLQVELASDRAFASVVAGASVRTGAYRDWTAKLTLAGLQPGQTYWYRFIAPDGSHSPVGRSRTLPVGDVAGFKLGLFSCANLPMGWFNAYAHAAQREDMDLWLHVGDYLYEYGIAAYKTQDRIAEREVLPAHDHEMISLLDYRLRFACYRADPDLQALHQNVAMVALWDDHESANDSWEGGAQNHQPATEGDWNARKAAAMQAYREWMPVSEEPWKAYRIGNLGTLYRTESRLIGRTQPADIGSAYLAGTDAALETFRDGPWQDPSATMLGLEQETWLYQAMADNARHSQWQLVGMGTILGRTLMPPQTLGMLRSDASERTAQAFRNNIRGTRLGLPMWMDRWDGYPAARARLLRAAQQADAELVMLSGDSHNAWAYSLQQDGQAAGVEFAVQGVTSGGIEGSLGAAPADVARAFMATNPELSWCDTSRRGYALLDITPQRINGEWIFVRDIKARGTATDGSHRMQVERGRRAFTAPG